MHPPHHCISYNNNLFTYVVEGRRVMKPYEVNPLAQIKPKYLNESTMILMTCAPSGSKTLRLLVSGSKSLSQILHP